MIAEKRAEHDCLARFVICPVFIRPYAEYRT